MSHLDFPIKATLVSVLNFSDCRQTELHASGCAHEKKALRVGTPGPPPTADDPYGDDWYHVAPCARKATS